MADSRGLWVARALGAAENMSYAELTDLRVTSSYQGHEARILELLRVRALGRETKATSRSCGRSGAPPSPGRTNRNRSR